MFFEVYDLQQCMINDGGGGYYVQKDCLSTPDPDF